MGDNTELIDKLGIVNPLDKTRMFVHPASLQELIKEFTDVREEEIHLCGIRIRIVVDQLMPVNKAWFAGRLLTFGEEGEAAECASNA